MSGTFTLWLPHGALEVSEDSSVVRGESHFYTQQGNRHTVWTPQSLHEVEVAYDAVRGLGEDPFGLAMNPMDHDYLKATILCGSSAVVKKKAACECGSAKAKIPTHSPWCPVA